MNGGGGFERHRSVAQVVAGKVGDSMIRAKDGNSLDKIEPTLSALSIAKGTFFQHELGDKQIESAAPLIPPLVGQFLMCRDQRIATGSCSEVAQGRCFQVHL